MGMFHKFVVRYANATKNVFEGRYALLANTASGGVLFLLGDTIEQGIEISRGNHPGQVFDWKRFARIGAVGVLEGPPHHYFYKYLDKYLPTRDKGTITKKILLDQFIACPMFNIQFFMGMAYFEGKDIKCCWLEFKKKFPTVYLVDWLLWPPFQLLNFYLIPPGFRVLYVHTVTTFWNVFLSYMKHYDQFEVTQESEKKLTRQQSTVPICEDSEHKNSLYKYFHARNWWPFND